MNIGYIKNRMAFKDDAAYQAKSKEMNVTMLEVYQVRSCVRCHPESTAKF